MTATLSFCLEGNAGLIFAKTARNLQVLRTDHRTFFPPKITWKVSGSYRAMPRFHFLEFLARDGLRKSVPGDIGCIKGDLGYFTRWTPMNHFNFDRSVFSLWRNFETGICSTLLVSTASMLAKAHSVTAPRIILKSRSEPHVYILPYPHIDKYAHVHTCQGSS